MIPKTKAVWPCAVSPSSPTRCPILFESSLHPDEAVWSATNPAMASHPSVQKNVCSNVYSLLLQPRFFSFVLVPLLLTLKSSITSRFHSEHSTLLLCSTTKVSEASPSVFLVTTPAN